VKYFFSFALLFLGIIANTQTTVIFQPDSACGKDAVIGNLVPNANHGTHPDFLACAWTNAGNPSSCRSLISFDLTTIPAGATIIQATLELFHYASPLNAGHSNMSGPASCWLERIIQPWGENTVTWNNQPITSGVNQLNVPAPTSMTQNYSINVFALVNDILNDPANSFGFELRLQNESYYRSLLFASSDMSNSALHPKLTIVYDYELPPLAGCWNNYVYSSNNVPPVTDPDPIVQIPNVFTPNGDGVNDTFFADSVSYAVSEFLIYDRWGVLVFESRPGKSWDGNFNNKECADGTYYYLLRYSPPGSTERVMKGFVMLIR
jgi:gliding motility-associated-like protein